jgi:hypothetical protein
MFRQAFKNIKTKTRSFTTTKSKSEDDINITIKDDINITIKDLYMTSSTMVGGTLGFMHYYYSVYDKKEDYNNRNDRIYFLGKGLTHISIGMITGPILIPGSIFYYLYYKYVSAEEWKK